MIELRDDEVLFDEITTLGQFAAAVQANRPLVIAGASGRRVHPRPRECSGVQERLFRGPRSHVRTLIEPAT